MEKPPLLSQYIAIASFSQHLCMVDTMLICENICTLAVVSIFGV